MVEIAIAVAVGVVKNLSVEGGYHGPDTSWPLGRLTSDRSRRT